MIIVEKNLSHGSGVVLSRDFFSDNESSGNFFKSSTVPSGIQNIKREIEGFSWYSERRECQYNLEILIQKERYIKVRYPRVIGRIPNPALGYVANIFFIEEVINHYIGIWSPYSFEKMAPVHGDLSLAGNVLFTDNGPFIIDWEHFLPSGAPIGFDALYFLFELLWLGNSKATDQATIDHLIKMVYLLNKNGCISDYFKGGYLSNVISFIDNGKNIWGSQRYKMPLRFFDKELIGYIDKNVLITHL